MNPQGQPLCWARGAIFLPQFPERKLSPHSMIRVRGQKGKVKKWLMPKVIRLIRISSLLRHWSCNYHFLYTQIASTCKYLWVPMSTHGIRIRGGLLVSDGYLSHGSGSSVRKTHKDLGQAVWIQKTHEYECGSPTGALMFSLSCESNCTWTRPLEK
jgi:hypothetical protein